MLSSHLLYPLWRNVYWNIGHFKNWVFPYWVVKLLHIFWIQIIHQAYNLQIFPSSLWLNIMVSSFYFLQFQSEFGNKEFMIWATVRSRSFYCWLYRASPSLAAKSIINLILALTIWWCPCVGSSLVLLEGGGCYDCAFSWQNSISLCPASFCNPRPNLPATPCFLDFLFSHSSPL